MEFAELAERIAKELFAEGHLSDFDSRLSVVPLIARILDDNLGQGALVGKCNSPDNSFSHTFLPADNLYDFGGQRYG